MGAENASDASPAQTAALYAFVAFSASLSSGLVGIGGATVFQALWFLMSTVFPKVSLNVAIQPLNFDPVDMTGPVGEYRCCHQLLYYAGLGDCNVCSSLVQINHFGPPAPPNSDRDPNPEQIRIRSKQYIRSKRTPKFGPPLPRAQKKRAWGLGTVLYIYIPQATRNSTPVLPGGV